MLLHFAWDWEVKGGPLFCELLALGLAPGPEIGKLLHEIRDKQLAEELKSREEALAWAKQRCSGREN